MTSVVGHPSSRQERWTRSTDVPLLVTAGLFLVAYAWDVVTLALSHDRFRWFYTHLFDFLLVVLPFLRPLRLLRGP